MCICVNGRSNAVVGHEEIVGAHRLSTTLHRCEVKRTGSVCMNMSKCMLSDVRVNTCTDF